MSRPNKPGGIDEDDALLHWKQASTAEVTGLLDLKAWLSMAQINSMNPTKGLS
jgi:hypothetical protein